MKKILISLLFVTFLSGCSSTIDKQRVDKVDSVAIVGFSVFKQADDIGQMVNTFSESAEFTKNLTSDFYKTFSMIFSHKLKVKVLTENKVKSNRYYKSLVKKYGPVKKLIMLVGKNYRATGMLSGQGVFDMTPAEKTKLASSLGVDSIIGLEALVYKGSSSFGFATQNVKFRVTVSDYEQYDADSLKPIVEFSNFIGSTPEESYKAMTGIGLGFNVSSDRKALVAAVAIIAEEMADEIKNAPAK